MVKSEHLSFFLLFLNILKDHFRPIKQIWKNSDLSKSKNKIHCGGIFFGGKCWAWIWLRHSDKVYFLKISNKVGYEIIKKRKIGKFYLHNDRGPHSHVHHCASTVTHLPSKCVEMSAHISATLTTLCSPIFSDNYEDLVCFGENFIIKHFKCIKEYSLL